MFIHVYPGLTNNNNIDVCIIYIPWHIHVPWGVATAVAVAVMYTRTRYMLHLLHRLCLHALYVLYVRGTLHLRTVSCRVKRSI